MSETTKSKTAPSTERTKAWRKREQERRKLLKSTGLVDVRIPVKEEQAAAVKGLIKLFQKENPNIDPDRFLFHLFQPQMIQVVGTYQNHLKKSVLDALRTSGIDVDPDKVRVEYGNQDEVLKNAGPCAVSIALPDEDTAEGDGDGQ
jgi:hypothetical protein